MAVTPLNIIYSWFETGDYPTEAQFQATWSSFWHKSESLPMSSIEGLNAAFQNTVSAQTFNSHLSDPNAHAHLARTDAGNITAENRASWRQKLGISDLQIEGPFNNLSEACAAIPLSQRFGKTVVIVSDGTEFEIGHAVEYWWRFGNSDGELILKNVGGGGNGSSNFPTDGDNGDFLEKDTTKAKGVKWSKKFASLTDKWLHYYDAATARFQPILKFVAGIGGNPNQLEFSGRIKADAVVLPPNSNTAVANRLRSDGSGLFFANSSANERKISIGSVFNYTPTGNFTLSQVKTAAENAGYVWNDLTVEISLGTNNFTCNIDTAVGTIVYLTRTGSGSISFTSARTLDSGIDNISILSGNNSSFAAILQKSDKDYLKIKIY